MKRLPYIAIFFAAVLLVAADKKPAQLNGDKKPTAQIPNNLLVEVWSPKREYDPKSPILIGTTFTNISGKRLTFRLPYKWKGITKGKYKVFHNGKGIASKLTFAEIRYLKSTTLEKDESVSFLFMLDHYYDVPTDLKKRLGRYEISLKKAADSHRRSWLRTQNIVVWVSENPAPIRLGLESLDLDPSVNDILVNQAALIIQRKSLSPEGKLKLLKMALATKRKNDIWRLILKCDDPYALYELLPQIPDDLLDGKGLMALLPSKDLAIRRTALKHLSRLPKSKLDLPALKTFLKTQSDEIVLELGKAVFRDEAKDAEKK